MSNKITDAKEIVCITGEHLTIREFKQNDLEGLLAYETQPGMCQFEPGLTDSDTAQSYLNNAIRYAREVPRTNYYLGVTLPPRYELIGRVSLTIQNPSISEWEIGWAIRMDDWGKGYAPESARQILEFAFRNLHAHRVVAFCHVGNAQSAKVMEKIGMQREGYLRQTRWFKEAWADELIYAILDVDFFRMESHSNDTR